MNKLTTMKACLFYLQHDLTYQHIPIRVGTYNWAKFKRYHEERHLVTIRIFYEFSTYGILKDGVFGRTYMIA